MNSATRDTMEEVIETIEELTDYKRPVCYRLSEIMVIPEGNRWVILWQKHPQ